MFRGAASGAGAEFCTPLRFRYRRRTAHPFSLWEKVAGEAGRMRVLDAEPIE
jgi:hypothetical protein